MTETRPRPSRETGTDALPPGVGAFSAAVDAAAHALAASPTAREEQRAALWRAIEEEARANTAAIFAAAGMTPRAPK